VKAIIGNTTGTETPAISSATGTEYPGPPIPKHIQ
jgi:hypothetical protein